MDISGLAKQHKPSHTAMRKLPMQFLCEFSNAVLDSETGELLQCWHCLINCPTHHTILDRSFGNEVGCLSQGMPCRAERTGAVFLFMSIKFRGTEGRIEHTHNSCV